MIDTDYYIDEVQTEVLAYLDEHPHAADTTEGIRRWWLTQRLAKCSQRRVQQALDRLVALGWVSRHDAPDGRTIYECISTPCDVSKSQRIHSLNHR